MRVLKIHGVRLKAGAPPLTEALDLPLADLTILLGANDTGKTSVLTALAADDVEFDCSREPWEVGPIELFRPCVVRVPSGVDAVQQALGRAIDALSGALGDVQRGAVLDAVTAAIDSTLPKFVARSYRVAIVDGSLPKLLIADREGGDSFDPRVLARGLRLWVELALYDVIDRVERLAASTLLGDARGAPLVDTLLAPLASEVPSHSVSELQLQHVADLLRIRIYLIDEPEQHLHARACREARRWLETRMDVGREMAVIATHHRAFLDVDSSAQYVELRRTPPGPTAAHPFHGRDLIALDERARRLGFDRGELFSLVRVVLLVEGMMDQALLQGWVGPELAELRVVIEVLGGTGKLGSGDLGLVSRLTSVPLVLLVDAVPAEVLVALARGRRRFPFASNESDPHRPYRGELNALLGVLDEYAGRTARAAFASLPSKDVLDLLDLEAVEAIRQHAHPGGVPWIDRSQARASDIKNLLKRMKRGDRDDVLERVACEQRERDAVPHDVRVLLDVLRDAADRH